MYHNISICFAGAAAEPLGLRGAQVGNLCSTCLEHCCAYHHEVKFYYTASGIVTPCRWPSGGGNVENVCHVSWRWTSVGGNDVFEYSALVSQCVKSVLFLNDVVSVHTTGRLSLFFRVI